MSSRPRSVVWNADPHTIAKVEIVRKYLYRWALITGSTFGNQPLTYIDGFAGPGEYENYPEGSPLAGINALNDAKRDAGPRWKASSIRALFVEQDQARKTHLEALIKARGAGDVGWIARESTFVEGLAYAEGSFAKAFFTSAPLVVFIDPFGATGFPWNAVVRILSSKTSEIILNFDADGIGRILAAGKDANADEILTTIYGDDEWRSVLPTRRITREVEYALVDLYKRKLRSLPNVKYTFAFEMASTRSKIDYFLLFASQHPLGLIKMKESMRELDKNGAYRFCDADRDQSELFRYDQPEDWVPRLVRDMGGKTMSHDDALTYVLNETPFFSITKLLAAAEKQGMLEVVSKNPKRRRGTFPESDIVSLTVRESVIA